MNEGHKCPIWGSDATQLENERGRDGKYFDSVRTDGKYFISETVKAMIGDLMDIQKVLLTDWLIEKRRLGTDVPEITSTTLEECKKRRETPIDERAFNFLRFIKEKTQHIGFAVSIGNSRTVFNDNLIFDDVLARTSSLNFEEVTFLRDYCRQNNWVDINEQSTLGDLSIIITAQGYAALSESDQANESSSNAFVAMWFDASMNKPYDQGIHAAVNDCGFNPIRVDAIEHIEKIDDRILYEIKRSRFVVVDFTSEKEKPRGGVYYEAGFAQGLGIPVIWTCREDCIGDVHFDTRQFNHIIWKTPKDLRESLKNRISAVIGDGPNK